MEASTTRAGAAVMTVLVLLLGGGACSSGDDDGPGDGAAGLGTRTDTDDPSAVSDPSDVPAIDPCDLLEIAEIEAELGEGGAVADGNRAELGPAAETETCSWDIGNPPDSGGFVILSITHRQKEPLAFEGPFVGDAVDGLGDEAYAHSSPAGTGLDVITGDWYVDITGFLYPDPGGMPDRMLTLTRHIVDRL